MTDRLYINASDAVMMISSRSKHYGVLMTLSVTYRPVSRVASISGPPPPMVQQHVVPPYGTMPPHCTTVPPPHYPPGPPAGLPSHPTHPPPIAGNPPYGKSYYYNLEKLTINGIWSVTHLMKVCKNFET